MPETTHHALPTAPRSRPQPRFAALVALAAFVLTGAALATVEAGDGLVDEGRFAEAIEVYQQVLEARPDDARAHYRLARAAVYRADALPGGDDDAKEALFDLAASHATRASRLAPDDADAHFEVARALGRLAQYRGVLASLNLASRVASALDRALELDPEHAGAWHARALYHHEVPWIAGGRSGLVLPAFRRAIDIEPDVIAHRLELAKVLIARGDEAAAAEALRVAVSLTPRTYLDREDLEEARGLLDGTQ
jgi:tetratricopeptide (TPR) repeat protein